MIAPSPPAQRPYGFSLIELTIVMTIMGLLLAAAASLYDIHQKKRRIDLTNERIQSAQASILEYARSNGFYPCPAPINAAIDTAQYATAADCSATAPPSGIGQANGRAGRKVWVGALPSRTLGTSGQIALDGWDQRLFYAVSKNIAVPTTGINQDDGAIKIIDANDNIIADGTAHYVLVSAGPDGKGAFSAQGGLIAPCNSAPGKDTDNCVLNTSTFRATDNRAIIAGANHYDDFVAHTIDLEISNSIPPGAIMAFRTTACPSGWTQATDLSGRVVIGTGTLGTDTYNLSAGGGSARHNVAIANLPSHNHRSTINPPKVATSTNGNHSHGAATLANTKPGATSSLAAYVGQPIKPSDIGLAGLHPSAYTAGNPNQSAAGQHAHTVQIPAFNVTSTNTGGGQPLDTRPPYRALLYCEKA